MLYRSHRATARWGQPVTIEHTRDFRLMRRGGRAGARALENACNRYFGFFKNMLDAIERLDTRAQGQDVRLPTRCSRDSISRLDFREEYPRVRHPQIVTKAWDMLPRGNPLGKIGDHPAYPADAIVKGCALAPRKSPGLFVFSRPGQCRRISIYRGHYDKSPQAARHR